MIEKQTLLVMISLVEAVFGIVALWFVIKNPEKFK